MPRQDTIESQQAGRNGKKYFTLAEARHALVLVKRIATDIQATQAERLRLHALLTASTEGPPETTLGIQDRLEVETSRLERLVEELAKMGVDLKDPARALLDFPSRHEGREILLCWMADEATILHWHEVDGGYAARRSVDELDGD